MGKLPSPFWVRVQRSAFWLVPLLVVLLVGLIGVGIALQQSISRGIFDASVPNSAVFDAAGASAPAQMDARAILSAYLQAAGGPTELANLRSMALSGRLDEGQAVSPVQIVAIKPDMGMLSVNRPNGESERLLMNGEKAWRVVQTAGQESLGELDPVEILALRAIIRILDPLASVAVDGTGMIASTQATRYMGQHVYEVTIDRFDGSVVHCFLNQETFHLVGVREERALAGQTYVVEVRMSDFREISNIVRPHAWVVRIDGKLYGRLFADDIRFNSGVMSSVFDVPAALPGGL